MVRLVFLLPVLLACALACDGASNNTRGANAPAAIFAKSECPFDDSSIDSGVTCGFLRVPSDREDPESKTIKLAVAVFHARDDVLDDPIVYLEGGPGGHALQGIDVAFDSFIEPFLDERDFIVFDQRGAGFSEPELNCIRLDDLRGDVSSDLSDEKYQERILVAIDDCRDDLEDHGIDHALANSAENAADLNDLRIALGYDKWNLYGISYGTRLALTAMRDHPDGIRSVILDSTYPPEVDLVSGGFYSTDRAFNALFDDCATDDECDDTYPDLKEVFMETVDDLNDDPALVEDSSFFELESDIVLTGDLFAGTLFQSLYATDLIGSLPEFIYQTSEGDYDFAAALIATFSASYDYLTSGMYMSVECTEEVPFSSLELVRDEAEKYPDFADSQLASLESSFEECEAWDAPAADAVENEPVESDIPTLVVAGRYDPITPPDWGHAVADRLATAYFFEFPASGHGVIPSDSCAERVAQRFLADPLVEPSPSCLDRLDPPVFEDAFGF